MLIFTTKNYMLQILLFLMLCIVTYCLKMGIMWLAQRKIKKISSIKQNSLFHTENGKTYLFLKVASRLSLINTSGERCSSDPVTICKLSTSVKHCKTRYCKVNFLHTAHWLLIELWWLLKLNYSIIKKHRLKLSFWNIWQFGRRKMEKSYSISCVETLHINTEWKCSCLSTLQSII